MTQDDRALEDKVANAAALLAVDITATDAYLLNVDSYVVLVMELGDGRSSKFIFLTKGLSLKKPDGILGIVLDAK